MSPRSHLPIDPRRHVVRHAVVALLLSVVGAVATTAQVELEPDYAIPFGTYNVAVALSPDGSMVAGGTMDGGYTTVFDIATGDSLGPSARFQNDRVSSIAWSPTGDRIAITGFRNTAIWSVEPWEKIRSIGADSNAHRYAVAWSSDGRRLATGNQAGTAFVWDVETGALLYRHHFGTAAESDIFDLQFIDGDTRLFVASHNGAVHLWNLETDERDLTIVVEKDPRYQTHSKGDIDTNAMIIATTSSYSFVNRNGTIKLWDARTGDSIGTLMGLMTNAIEIEFSRDGTHLIACDGLETVLVWNVASRAVVASLRGNPPRTYDVDININAGIGRFAETGNDMLRIYDFDLVAAAPEPIAGESGLRIRNVTPNPADGEAVIDFSVMRPSMVSLQILDASGRIALDLPSWHVEGEGQAVLRTESLPIGTYLVRISSGRERIVTALRVVR